MPFETLKRSHLKRNIIIGVVVLIISAIVLYFTRAKYRVTESIPLVNGTINYDLADLNAVAVYIEEEDDYSKSDTIPSSGYTFNEEKSYCTVNGEEDTSITVNYDANTQSLSVSPLTTKGTKCYLYFRYPHTIPELIESKIIDQRTDFDSTLASNTTGTLFKAEDDDGISYYFAGAVDDNYVKFGGFYWRIIRINGNGSMRMIYQGKTPDAKGKDSVINESVAFNVFTTELKDNAYVGYMYGTVKSNNYEETHANTNDSNIKEVVDEWYKNNLLSYDSYIDKNSGFCGDREISSGLGYGTNETDYAAYDRLFAHLEKKPTLKCSNPNRDLYTVSEANNGNKALTYPIGLITADEISYAGGIWNNDENKYNYSFYLYIGDIAYWAMTPHRYTGSSWSASCLLGSSGHLSATGSQNSHGVRPVINLKSDVTFKGAGTVTDPYVVN